MDEDSGYVGRDNSSSLEVVKKGPSKSLVGSSRKGSKMDVVVDNRKGGRIISNDPALAAWSVDAIRIVRDQLYKAGDEHSPLPHFENWSSEKTEFRKHSSDDSNGNFLPRWARRVKDLSKRTMKDFHDEGFDFENIAISNLSLMAVEVQGLLESMASQLQRQRDRRLEKLRPALRVRRHWYVIAAGAPFIGYASYCLVKDSWGITASKQIISNITDFWKEHVAEPLSYV